MEIESKNVNLSYAITQEHRNSGDRYAGFLGRGGCSGERQIHSRGVSSKRLNLEQFRVHGAEC